MDELFEQILLESEALELNVGRVYLLFKELFPEHADFWWRLAIEEENHAAIIKSGRQYFAPVGKFPREIVCQSLEALKQANASILEKIKSISLDPIDLPKAFNLALSLEKSAGEIQMHTFMNKVTDTKTEAAFQKLASDCQEHFQRIVQYMKANGIPVKP